MEDADPTFSRTKEKYTRTLAAAIEVLRGRGTSAEHLSDFYGEYSDPRNKKLHRNRKEIQYTMSMI